jgi:putative addiction module component (TIGR02574 family)
MENLDELTRQVLDLPLDQRSALAEKLLESLDELAPDELEQVWAAEAERRFQAFEDDRVEAVEGTTIHREIIAELK